MKTLGKAEIPLKLFKRGKVRDVFESDGQLLIVSTDRISAFDYVLPSTIPEKGRILNQLAVFFFDFTRDLIPNHVVSGRPETLPAFIPYAAILEERSMLARKLIPFPLEAIVRSHIFGTGWNSYQKSGFICGVRLPAGLRLSQRLEEPIFTPTSKAESGHDQDMTYDQLAGLIGDDDAREIRRLSLRLFAKVSDYCQQRGIIVADSKFEFGRDDSGSIVLIDEIFTPDSSRFWKVEDYRPGIEPPSLDKQYVRNWLLSSGWDRQSPPPALPDEIISRTSDKYREIFRRLTGRSV